MSTNTGTHTGTNSRDRWFVQTGNEKAVLMASMDIVNALVAGTLKINYRVSRDGRAWKAICNEDYFENLIKTLINEASAPGHFPTPQDSSKNSIKIKEDLSGFHDIKDLSSGISEQLNQAQKINEVNVQITSLRKILVTMAVQKKTIIKINMEEKKEEFNPEDASEYIVELAKPKAFRWQEHKKITTLLTIVILLLGAQTGYQMYDQQKMKEEADRIERIKKEAITAKTIGNYDKALSLFSAIKDSKNLDPKTLLEMAELAVQKNDFKGSSGFCGQVLNISTDPIEKARAHSILGLINLRSGDLDSADKEFQISLRENPNLYSALHNLGVVYLNKKSYEIAEKLFIQALSIGEERDVPTILGLAEVAIALEAPDQNLLAPPTSQKSGPAQGNKFERITRVDKMLEELSSASDNFMAEILTARIRIASIKKNTPLVEQLTRQLIDLNPAVVENRMYKLELDYDRTRWDNIYSWCVDTYTAEKHTPIVSALLASCLLEIHNAAQALPYSQFAYRSLQRDPLMKGLYAYILNSTGDTEEAKKLFKDENDPSLSKLSLIAMGKICDKQKDQKCSQKFWDKLHALDPNDPSGISGVATLNYEKGDLEMAQKVLKAGLSRNPASKELQQIAEKLKPQQP